MAKSEKVDVGTISIGGVNIIRWWRSREMWNYIAGLVLVIGPIVLNGIADLGLSATHLLFWTVGVNIAIFSAGTILRNTSTSIIGNKRDVAIADRADAELPEPVENDGLGN